MNLEQYESPKPLVAGQIVDYAMPVCRESLSVSELSNPTQDRTLLWGFSSKLDFH